MQDQDRSVPHEDQDQDRHFWSETGLVLRPTVSDHTFTGFYKEQILVHYPQVLIDHRLVYPIYPVYPRPFCGAGIWQ